MAHAEVTISVEEAFAHSLAQLGSSFELVESDSTMDFYRGEVLCLRLYKKELLALTYYDKNSTDNYMKFAVNQLIEDYNKLRLFH